MEKNTQQVSRHNTTPFFALLTHPVKFRLYLLKHIPSAFFSRLKVVRANSKECCVSVPFTWFTQNPFRSTYFACLSMAAELSTGALAMANIYGRKPSVSMLVTGMEARYYKKAKGQTYFLCQDGEGIAQAITSAVATGTGQDIKVYSCGTNREGELVAEFWFTWSFKLR